MATNKHPWVRNLFGASQPLVIKGLVQAGSTKAIKMGEICVYNETSGNWVPADAAGDYIYSLAVANEEQKTEHQARYMEFVAPREGDVFEFALSAAAAVALGNAVKLSDSQTLTVDVDGAGIGHSVGDDNYPLGDKAGVTVRSKSNVQMVFHREVSYLYKNMLQSGLKKVIDPAGATLTLKLEDCGAIVTNKTAGALALTGPTSIVPVGYNFKMVCANAATFSFDPKPDTASCIIKGGAQTAGKLVSVTDEGDFIEWVWDGTDWIAVNSVSGADGDITVEG